jgi:hypothetical protein
MQSIRSWLGQLPPEVAEQLAYRNAERLFGNPNVWPDATHDCYVRYLSTHSYRDGCEEQKAAAGDYRIFFATNDWQG